MSAIILDGSIVHYEALGRGRPVVFLHGWVGSWKYWISSMQTASTSYRAYALDLWGFGDTAHNAERYSLEQQAALIDRFFAEMGIGKVAFVGHGMGALVSMLFATRFPRSVDRVMTISCPLAYDSVSARLQSSSAADLANWLASGAPDAAVALADASKADSQAIAASLDGLRADNFFSGFRALNIPTLFVYGEKDQAIVAPDEERINSTMIQQVILEESGHFPMLDETVKFNRLLTDFLALESGASPSELEMKDEWRRRVR
ncbi:MAG: alpha/beta hydrolase [Anaerolineaceae bacterium]|nr:MAG: alpha/beta hydrolase [Anaerolineaceae bacterium]